MLGFLYYFFLFITVAWPVDVAFQHGARRTAILAAFVMLALPALAWWALPYIQLFGVFVVHPIVQIVVSVALVRYVRRTSPTRSVDQSEAPNA
jgi:hypothetical protein